MELQTSGEFRGFIGSLSLRPVHLLVPLADLTGHYPADRDFYSRAFGESVTLLTVGYNYGGT